MNSKKILTLFLASILGLAPAGNVLAFGGIDTLMQAREKAEGFKEDAAAKGICFRIGEISSKVGERMNQKEENIKERIQNRLGEVEKNRKERDNNLSEFRANTDQWREDNYKLLEEKATTNEQKQAVEKFRKTIEAAVKTRRGAIDSAIDAFRGGADEAWAGHKSSFEGVMSAHRSSAQTAFQKANTDCDKGVDEKTIRTNLRASLQSAKSQLRENRAGIPKFRDSMQGLIAAKKTAFKEAIFDFKAAVKAAVEELKKSFPESD